MSEKKIVTASIVNYLKQQLDTESVNVESRESVEVAVQCIEAAFELTAGELAQGVDLAQAVRRQRNAPAAVRAEAEQLKNEGNELMKAERHREALERYTRAIQMEPRNSVFFCNRAAAYFKLGDHEAAVADSLAALSLQPEYSKAHGRLGLALTALDRHAEARAAFARASQLDPDNETYKQNLRLAEERVAQRDHDRRQLDLGGLLQNPALLSMATEMLSDPNMQTLISGLMGSAGGQAGAGAAGAGGAEGAGGVSALLEAGQVLAQHMQNANPDLVEQLRQRMRPAAPPPAAASAAPPAPGGNPPPPPPPPPAPSQ